MIHIRKSQLGNPVCQRAAALDLQLCDPYRDWRYAYFEDIHRVRESDPVNGRFRTQPARPELFDENEGAASHVFVSLAA
jgi:hypothetical protein